MKKLILAAATIWFVAVAAFAQVGDLLKKAKEKVQNKIEDKIGVSKQTETPADNQPTDKPQNTTENPTSSRAMPAATETESATRTYTPIATVEAEKITMLPDKAVLVYEESGIQQVKVSSNKKEIKLVVRNPDNSYQVFSNGQWSTPIKKIDPSTAKQYGISVQISDRRNLYRFASEISPGDDNNGLIKHRKMMMNGIPIGEELVIVHKGKTYGPYVTIQEAALSNDGEHFFAIVMPKFNDDYSKMWQEYRLIGDQLSKPLQIIPPDNKSSNLSFKLLASGDGKSAVIAISDFSNYQSMKEELLFHDGRRFTVESSKEDGLLFDRDNSFFSPDGKSFCTLQDGKSLYVNGKLTKSFSEHQNLSRSMFNEKGEELFKVSHKGIAFADGTIAPVAVKISTFTENNKLTVAWLAPYGDGSIYLCKKTL